MHGGHCLVAWDTVCTPKEIGGIGLSNLRLLNLALRAHWPSMGRVMVDKPWREFNIQVPPDSMALFRAAMKINLGDGEQALFWDDRWLEEGRIPDLAPNLIKFVNKRVIKVRTIKEGIDRIF